MEAKLVFLTAILAAAAFLALLVLSSGQQAPTASYFVYGANLDAATMRARAGGFLNSTPATLHGYRVAFQTNRNSEFGVANLVADQSGVAYGAIYDLTRQQAAFLDKAAGVPGFYEKRPVIAELSNGTEAAAAAYFLEGGVSYAPPSRPYMAAASQGLVQFGFGQDAQDALAASASEAGQKNGGQN
jgi:Gamma-glutamyl cyclotransferase, AIG2-like